MTTIVATLGSNPLPVVLGVTALARRYKQDVKAVAIAVTDQTAHMTEPVLQALEALEVRRIRALFKPLKDSNIDNPNTWRAAFQGLGITGPVAAVYTGGTRAMSVALHHWAASLDDSRTWSVDALHVACDQQGERLPLPDLTGLGIELLGVLHDCHEVTVGRPTSEQFEPNLWEARDPYPFCNPGPIPEGEREEWGKAFEVWVQALVAKLSPQGTVVGGNVLGYLRNPAEPSKPARQQDPRRDPPLPHPTWRNFELDVVTIFGPRAAVIEVKSGSKDGLAYYPDVVEAGRRARQFAGMRAGAALICRSDAGTVTQLRGQARGTTASDVAVFGKSDIAEAIETPEDCRLAGWLAGHRAT